MMAQSVCVCVLKHSCRKTLGDMACSVFVLCGAAGCWCWLCLNNPTRSRSLLVQIHHWTTHHDEEMRSPWIRYLCKPVRWGQTKMFPPCGGGHSLTSDLNLFECFCFFKPLIFCWFICGDLAGFYLSYPSLSSSSSLPLLCLHLFNFPSLTSGSSSSYFL